MWWNLLICIVMWTYSNLWPICVVILTFILGAMVTKYFNKKNLKFLGFSVNPVGEVSNVGFGIVNNGGRELKIRKITGFLKDGTRSPEKSEGRNLQQDENGSFQISFPGEIVNKDIHKIIVEDSATDNWTGYAYKGRLYKYFSFGNLKRILHI